MAFLDDTDDKVRQCFQIKYVFFWLFFCCCCKIYNGFAQANLIPMDTIFAIHFRRKKKRIMKVDSNECKLNKANTNTSLCKIDYVDLLRAKIKGKCLKLFCRYKCGKSSSFLCAWNQMDTENSIITSWSPYMRYTTKWQILHITSAAYDFLSELPFYRHTHKTVSCIMAPYVYRVKCCLCRFSHNQTC